MSNDNQTALYDGKPSVMVFADTEEGRAASEDLVGCVLGWPVKVAAIEDAVERLDGAISIGAVLVDVRHDGGEPLDRLLDRLDLAARHDRHASVVLLPAALIDLAAARAPHPNVALLVGASAIEQGAALGLATRMGRSAPHLLGEERGAPGQLLQLSEEVGRIARTLAALSGAKEQRLLDTARDREVEPPSASTVRAMIRARRLREQFFDGALFADPAWDMLLDLLAARLEGRPVAVSSLCIAAAVPPTTALRWMKQLTDDRIFARVADPHDGRRVFIELADDAAGALFAYFQALARMGVTLP